MKTYKAYVTVYHVIEIEAENASEARKKAGNGAIWDDHIQEVAVDVEEIED